MKQRIIFAIIMSLLLSTLMTFWISWINLGWSNEFGLTPSFLLGLLLPLLLLLLGPKYISYPLNYRNKP
ncbi:DUF2798 domain-containing protein [Shewanella surugensis]|uniref:DUF2798 domain-containing protein n=1 Tax=Shewanella surugensis TaxID=212020 RepID=UPI0040693FA2